MAVSAVLGTRLLWVADNDPHAAAVLARRFPQVPNLGDLTAVDWAGVPAPDVLTAGFPCQPVSAAGRRKGITDERWLFDHICAAVGRMDPPPRLLVFENVAGLLSANGGDAMARVVQGLATLGYLGAWRVVRASDAGAPHRRERVFILAWHSDPAEDPNRATGRQRRLPAPRQAQSRGPWTDAGRRGGTPDAHTTGQHAGTLPQGDQPGQPQTPSGDSRGPAPHPQGHRRHQRRPQPARLIGRPDPAITGHTATDWGPYGPAIHRWEHILGRPAPRPTEPGRTGDRLSPHFVEWLMGLPDRWVTGIPGIPRNGQLRLLGNGVVPQQAITAVLSLLPGHYLPGVRQMEAIAS
ncbi:hypothetical protein GCM10009677_03120 [Sphaerisporangium rubeum]